MEDIHTFSLQHHFEYPDRYRVSPADGSPTVSGRSYHEHFNLGEGIALSVTSQFSVPSRRFYYEHEGYLSFHYLLSGGSCLTATDGQTCITQPKHCIVTSSAPVLCEIKYPKMLSCIDLVCSPSALRNFLRLPTAALPTSIDTILDSDFAHSLSPLFTMDNSFVQLLVEIMTDTQNSPQLRQLYLRAKIAELIYHTVCSMEANGHKKNRTAIHLRSWEVDSLNQVRHLIKDRLTTPPNLKEISQLTGINSSKLAAGFKQLFGTSIYQYGINVRLKEAERLLTTGAYSVAEVAERVGYSETASFSRMFHARYGKVPTAV